MICGLLCALSKTHHSSILKTIGVYTNTPLYQSVAGINSSINLIFGSDQTGLIGNILKWHILNGIEMGIMY